jgi:hypothetical protein
MIEQAILKINPNAKFTLAENSVSDYEVVWLEGTTPISKSEIEAQFPAVELEIAMADLRQKRNALLFATDYLALSDNTLSSDMSTYRAALRDITEDLTTVDEVEAVEFPTKP